MDRPSTANDSESRLHQHAFALLDVSPSPFSLEPIDLLYIVSRYTLNWGASRASAKLCGDRSISWHFVMRDTTICGFCRHLSVCGANALVKRSLRIRP